MGSGVRLCRASRRVWLEYLEHGGWHGRRYDFGKDGMNKEW